MRVEIRPAFGDTFVYGSTVISRAQVTGRLRRTIASWTGFTLSGLPSCFVFRASYGDADPKRLTDVKVRLFPVAASGGEAGADDDSQHSEEVLLTWSRDPKRGFYVEYSLCIRRLVRSLRLTGLTSGELGLFGLVGSGQAGRHYEMSGLGSQRSGAVLLAGLANGPRTHLWPAGLEVRYLPGWLGDRQTGQSGCSVDGPGWRSRGL